MPEFVCVFGGVHFDEWDWRPESAPAVVVDLFASWPARLSYLFNGKASVGAYYPGDAPTRARYCAPAEVGSALAAIAAKQGSPWFASGFLPVSFDGRAAAEAGLPGPGINYSLEANWDGSGLAITAFVEDEHVREAFERIRVALLAVAGDRASRVRCGWLETAQSWGGMVGPPSNRHDHVPFRSARSDSSDAGAGGYHPVILLSAAAARRLGGPLALAQRLGEAFLVSRARPDDDSAIVVGFAGGLERFGVADRRMLRSVLASELNLDLDLSRDSPRGMKLALEFRPSWVMAEDWIVGPPPTFAPAPPRVVAEGD